jgi:ABC-type uncharacterized transport system involved in gliding motility auxiliary subunit
MTKKQTTTISVLILTAFVLGALVCGRLWFRLDFTKDKLYTISEVSRNLYNEIPDQVQIHFYLSDKLKAMHPLPGEIVDLLREYTAYSRGKIKLTVRDPVKANLVELMEQAGIMPQQMQTMEQDQASIMTIYSGIIIEYLGMYDVLPWVFALETLEYDLTSRIRALVQERSRHLGILVGDNNPRLWNEEYRYLQSFLAQAGYRFRQVYPGEELTETLPALFVLGGVETLDETALYQIDRYIQNGGRVLFSVKSVFIDKEGGMEARLMYDNGLLEMISSYGVTLLPEIAMDRKALRMQYQTRTQSGAMQIRITQNPQWIGVENGNPEHPLGANFSGLDLFWASPLTLNAPRGVTAEYLFKTTTGGWSMREQFLTDPGISYFMERDADETTGEKILGASLSGIFPSWFAGKPKPEPLGEDAPELADMPETAKPARIIVIGETDFIIPFLNYIDWQRNFNFIIQAADWLSNDDDIIGIRSRGTGSGRLDKITDPMQRIAAMKAAQVINVFVIPLLVVLAGVLLAVMRKTKAQPRTVSINDADKTEKSDDDGVKEGHDDV